eukprot:12039911-Ditylum_brightwellii.AAC.2
MACLQDALYGYLVLKGHTRTAGEMCWQVISSTGPFAALEKHVEAVGACCACPPRCAACFSNTFGEARG